jgi:hypothetical protein
MAHWVSIRYGVSRWKARRWIVAGHAVERLPLVSEALTAGRLSLDKVVDLARFATTETEARLIPWADRVSVGAIRHRGDVMARVDREEVVETERARTLSWWWFEEERRLGLDAELPAAQGAVVVRAIERMAERVPPMPGEEDLVETRHADALVAICSAQAAPIRIPIEPRW